MAKIKLNLSEIVALDKELANLLKENISFGVKYEITKAKEKTSSVADKVNILKRELILKYGDKDEDGKFKIKEGSEAWDKFIDDFSPLLDKKEDIDFTLKLDDLREAKSENEYFYIMQFIEV